jgi:hypothetical protein
MKFKMAWTKQVVKEGVLVLSTVLCEILLFEFLEEGQILSHFS